MSIPKDRFTLRERQVLQRVGSGMTYPEIADELGIGPETVRTYAKLVKAKLPELDYLDLGPRATIRIFWHQDAA